MTPFFEKEYLCKCGKVIKCTVNEVLDADESYCVTSVECLNCGSLHELTLGLKTKVTVLNDYLTTLDLLKPSDSWYTGKVVKFEDGVHQMGFGSIVVLNGVIEQVFNKCDERQLQLDLV